MDYESTVRIVLAGMALLGGWLIYKQSKAADLSYQQKCKAFIRDKKGSYHAAPAM